MKDDQAACNGSEGLRREQPKWNNELNKMTEEHGEFVRKSGQTVEVPAKRIGQRLRFIVIEKTGQLPPARVMTQLDKSGAQFRSKKHPP